MVNGFQVFVVTKRVSEVINISIYYESIKTSIKTVEVCSFCECPMIVEYELDTYQDNV